MCVSTDELNRGVGDSSSTLHKVPIKLNNEGADPSNSVPVGREGCMKHMEISCRRKGVRGLCQTTGLEQSQQKLWLGLHCSLVDFLTLLLHFV